MEFGYKKISLGLTNEYQNEGPFAKIIIKIKKILKQALTNEEQVQTRLHEENI